MDSERNDFRTHLIYASLIASLSDGIKIEGSLKPKLTKKDLPLMKDKLSLINLTKKSIDDESSIVNFDQEYSTASVLWLPIKTYYLIYHLLCVIDYLVSGDSKSLSYGHYECVNKFNKLLLNGEIQFSNPILNTIFDSRILNFVSSSGEHLRHNASKDTVFKLIMKKTAKEKINNYKITYNLSSSKHKDKAKIKNFESNMMISIFDFFYLMRLRTNYRNLNFIDSIPSGSTKVYFEKYYRSSNNFYKALFDYVDDLISFVN